MSKAGEPIGSKVEQGHRPWKVGTWVWHAQTKQGPWIVVRDDGALVYVDSNPRRPASKYDPTRTGPAYVKVDMTHRDVTTHYASMLTDVKPPPWTSGIPWEKVGGGIGAVFTALVVAVLFLLYFWLEAGMPT